MDEKREADQLFDLLDAIEVHPVILASGLGDFSPESKNEFVARIAGRPEPSCSARLLARLPFIRTDENQQDMKIVFLRHLQSPLPEARKASLYGLDELGDPATLELAVKALNDPEDQVTAAAVDLLLRKAGPDLPVRDLLERLHAEHQGDERFRGTLNLLEARGIGKP